MNVWLLRFRLKASVPFADSVVRALWLKAAFRPSKSSRYPGNFSHSPGRYRQMICLSDFVWLCEVGVCTCHAYSAFKPDRSTALVHANLTDLIHVLPSAQPSVCIRPHERVLWKSHKAQKLRATTTYHASFHVISGCCSMARLDVSHDRRNAPRRKVRLL